MRHALILSAISLVLLTPAATVVRAEPPAAPPPAVPANADRALETFVSVSVRVIEATPRAVRSLRLLETARRPGDVSTYDSAALARRIECWTRAGHVTTVSAPRLLVLPKQTGNVTIGQDVSYIQDFEVEGSMVMEIANPVIGTVFEGLRVECKGELVPGGVSLDAKFQLSDVLRPIPEFETTLAGTKVKIELPEVRTLQTQRHVVLPPGRASLLADSVVAIRGRGDRVVLAWIEAQVVKETPAAPPLGAPASR